MKSVSSVLFLSLLHISNVACVTVSSNTTTSYDPAELLSRIFHPNITLDSRQRGYGYIKFEGQVDPDLNLNNQDAGQYGLIDLEGDPRPLKFEDDYNGQNYDPNFEISDNYQNNYENRPVKFEDEDYSQMNNGHVNFQDDNTLENQGNKKKRKKRRRRKPKKNGVLPYYPEAYGPGLQDPLQGGYGLYPQGNPGYPSQPIRRPRRRRPRPSLATEALSSITEALTSIARYDDYQCVPRLLCEAAGGGALSGNGLLQSIAGIQPLLTLLSAYNGISTSPLFVFGRAVFLGMTSKGNTGTCRYAYPQCPTDPEQLIYYLNNHNGGFFRFFSAPQLQNQNLEQFYNQLGQSYGVYQPNPAQQNYGYPNDPNSGQNYGLYQNNPNVNYPVPNNYDNYGTQRPYDKPSLYNGQKYGSNYAFDYNNYGGGNQIRFKVNDASIEKRIQNKPTLNLSDDNFDDDNIKTKWQFPDSLTENVNINDYNIRDSRTLKFPEENQSYKKDPYRKGKVLNFPRDQDNQYNYNQGTFYTNGNNIYETTTNSYNNRQNLQNYYNNRLNTYSYNNYQQYTTPKYNQLDQSIYNKLQYNYNNNQKYPSTTFNNEDYVFDYKHNFYVKKEKNNNFKRYEDDGLKTVYVVRGDGDPNKPEIVKLRPGEALPLY